MACLTHSSSQIQYIPYEEAYGDGFENMKRRVLDSALWRSNCVMWVEFPPHDSVCVSLDCRFII